MCPTCMELRGESAQQSEKVQNQPSRALLPSQHKSQSCGPIASPKERTFVDPVQPPFPHGFRLVVDRQEMVMDWQLNKI
jgi:hypothetical protein